MADRWSGQQRERNAPHDRPPQRPFPRTPRDRLPPLPRSPLIRPAGSTPLANRYRCRSVAVGAGGDRTGGTIAVPGRPREGRLLATKTPGAVPHPAPKVSNPLDLHHLHLARQPRGAGNVPATRRPGGPRGQGSPRAALRGGVPNGPFGHQSAFRRQRSKAPTPTERADGPGKDEGRVSGFWTCREQQESPRGDRTGGTGKDTKGKAKPPPYGLEDEEICGAIFAYICLRRTCPRTLTVERSTSPPAP